MPNVTVDVHVKVSDVQNTKAMLKENKIDFTIMISDLEYLVEEEEMSNQKNAFWGYYDYQKYNTYDDVSTYL